MAERNAIQIEVVLRENVQQGLDRAARAVTTFEQSARRAQPAVAELMRAEVALDRAHQALAEKMARAIGGPAGKEWQRGIALGRIQPQELTQPVLGGRMAAPPGTEAAVAAVRKYEAALASLQAGLRGTAVASATLAPASTMAAAAQHGLASAAASVNGVAKSAALSARDLAQAIAVEGRAAETTTRMDAALASSRESLARRGDIILRGTLAPTATARSADELARRQQELLASFRGLPPAVLAPRELTAVTGQVFSAATFGQIDRLGERLSGLQLKAELLGRAGGAGMKQFRDQINAAKTTGELQRIEASMTHLAAGAQRAGAAGAGFGAKMRTAAESAKAYITGAFGAAGAVGIGAFIGAALGTAIGSALLNALQSAGQKVREFFHGIREMATEQRAFQIKGLETGLAVRELESLQFASRRMGLDAANLRFAMRTLSDRVIENAGAFEAAGIKVRDQSGAFISVGEVLKQLGGIYSGTRDRMLEVSVAGDLLGRTGLAFIPLLKLGEEGFKRMEAEAASMAFVLSEKTDKALVEHANKVALADLKWEGMWRRLKISMLPMMTLTVEGVTALTDAVTFMGVRIGQEFAGAARDLQSFLAFLTRGAAGVAEMKFAAPAAPSMLPAHVPGLDPEAEKRLKTLKELLGAGSEAAKGFADSLQKMRDELAVGTAATAELEKMGRRLVVMLREEGVEATRKWLIDYVAKTRPALEVTERMRAAAALMAAAWEAQKRAADESARATESLSGRMREAGAAGETSEAAIKRFIRAFTWGDQKAAIREFVAAVGTADRALDALRGREFEIKIEANLRRFHEQMDEVRQRIERDPLNVGVRLEAKALSGLQAELDKAAKLPILRLDIERRMPAPEPVPGIRPGFEVGVPALTEDIDTARGALAALVAEALDPVNQARDAAMLIVGSTTDAIGAIVNGLLFESKRIEQAILGVLKSITQAVINLIVRMIALNLVTKVFGIPVPGGGGAQGAGTGGGGYATAPATAFRALPTGARAAEAGSVTTVRNYNVSIQAIDLNSAHTQIRSTFGTLRAAFEAEVEAQRL